MTVIVVWIGNWIHWALGYATLDYSLQMTVAHTHTVLLSHCLHQYSGNGFQQRTFPFRISELSLCLSYSDSLLTLLHRTSQ